MKKILLLSAMMLAFAFAQAQERNSEFANRHERNFESRKYVYCELVGTAKFLSKKLVVTIDFGQNRQFWSTKNEKLMDAAGEPIKFSSMVDAMNYMSDMDWEYVQAYVAEATDLTVYHWVLRKDVSKFSADERRSLFGPERKGEIVIK